MIIIDQNKEGCFWFGPGIGIDIKDDGPELGAYQIVAYNLQSEEPDDFICGEYAILGTAKAVLMEIIDRIKMGDKAYFMPPDAVLKEATWLTTE